MKGKIWELGPFVLAVLVGLYFVAERLRHAPPAPVEASAAGKPPAAARASTGPGDPTKAQDFLPDADSKPDPNGLPDPIVSTAARGASLRR